MDEIFANSESFITKEINFFLELSVMDNSISSGNSRSLLLLNAFQQASFTLASVGVALTFNGTKNYENVRNQCKSYPNAVLLMQNPKQYLKLNILNDIM